MASLCSREPKQGKIRTGEFGTFGLVASTVPGVRPWIRPWNAEHAAGRITRPLGFNGQPYSGINVSSLWMSALGQNFTAPIWMTARPAN